jgi:ribosome-associated protein
VQISRSEQKRRIQQLGSLVEELSGLGNEVIRQLPCSQEVRELLLGVQELKAGARKRQLKYITKLLRTEDTGPLYQFFKEKKGSSLQQKKLFHELEHLRDQLLNEALEQKEQCEMYGEVWDENWSSRILLSIEKKYPEVDLTALRRLAFLFARSRERKHSREVFRLLRAAQEKQHYQERGA